MNIGKPITQTWQEAIGMLSQCKVESVEVIQPGDLQIRQMDPAGQRFILRVTAAVGVGLTGDLVRVVPSLVINCFEVGS